MASSGAARRTTLASVIALASVVACLLLPTAASAGTVIDTSRCAAGTTATVLPSAIGGGSTTTASDCAITFGSTDGTAMLKLSQLDRAGSALVGPGNGTLDAAWGTAGFSAASARATRDAYTAVTRLADGGYAATGWSYAGAGDQDVLVAKLRADGSLDPSFNAGGAVPGTLTFTVPGSTSEEGYAIAQAPDGKLVVAGHDHPTAGTAQVLVARVRLDGTLDTGFAPAGAQPGVREVRVDPAATPYDEARSVAVGSDGKTYVTGPTSASFSGVVLRLTADGSLDDTWGTDGRAYLGVPGGATGQALAVGGDGTVLVGGRRSGGPWLAARLTARGRLDTTFGGSGTGWVSGTASGAGQNVVTGIATDGAGRVLLGGDVLATSHLGFAVRLSAAGVVDATWGTGGTTVLQPPTDSFTASGLLVGGDGTAYVFGTTTHPSAPDQAAVWHLAADGSPDARWGGAGYAAWAAASGTHDSTAWGATFTDDGHVLTVGTDEVAAGADLLTARWAANALPDFAGGSADWSTGASGMFGTCLRSLTGSAPTAWAPTGSCGATNADPWRAVPATSSDSAKVAATTAVGVTDASASLRFGARVVAGTPAGSYAAALVVDVVAPNLVPPANVTAPTVTGTASTRATLTAGLGTWSGTGPLAYATQWQSCAAPAFTTCIDIAGATAATYVPSAVDVGNQLRVQVTASSDEGTASATSTRTATVVAAGATGLQYVDGFEHGVVSANPSSGGLASQVGSGTTTTTDWARNGARSLRIAANGAVGSSLYVVPVTGAPGVVTERMAVSFEHFGSGSVYGSWDELLQVDTAAGGWGGISIDVDGTLRTDHYDGSTETHSATGVQLQLHRWYVLDVRYDASTATHAISWSVDGVAQPTYVHAGPATTLVATELGPDAGAGDRYAVDVDDLAVSGVAADYPLGPGKVTAFAPQASGSGHVNPGSFRATVDNGSTLTAVPGPPDTSTFAHVADWPPDMSATATGVVQNASDATGYLDYPLADSSEPSAPDLVGAIVARQSTGGANSPQSTWLQDGASSGAIFSGTENSSSPTYRATFFAAAPSGGSWTTAKFNAMSVRFGKVAAVGANKPRLDAALVQADFPTGTTPQVVAPPVVTGNAHVGLTLATSTGTWQFAPTAFAYHWLRCDAATGACTTIVGATGATYVLVGADRGQRIRAVVSATNANGTQDSMSASTSWVGAASPTLVYATGFEQGTASSSGGGLFSAVTGAPTPVSWPARSGRYAMQFTSTGSSANVTTPSLPASSHAVQRFSLLVRQLPVPGQVIHVTATIPNTCSGCRAARMEVNSAGQLRMAQIDVPASYRGLVVGPTIQLDRWYTIDMDTDLATSTWTTAWAVDGVPQPVSSGTGTSIAPDTVHNLLLSGNLTNTFSFVMDDLAVSETAADYPLGDGTVLGYVPHATGALATPGSFGYALNAAAPAFTTANASDANSAGDELAGYLADWPVDLSATGGVVRQTSTTGSTELLLGPSTEDAEPDGVRVTGAHREAAAGTENATLTAWQGASSTPLYSGDPGGGTATPYYFGGMLTSPPAGGAWTRAAFDGLSLRLTSTDIAPVPWTDAVMAEVDYPAAPAPTGVLAPTLNQSTSVARPGTTLATTRGTWTPTSSTTTVQWLRCDAAGGACTAIAGASGDTYVAQAADAGGTLRAAVTATNGGAAQLAFSPVVGVSTTPTEAFATGFEAGTVAGLWSATGGAPSIDSSVVRSGAYSLLAAPSAATSYVRRTLPAATPSAVLRAAVDAVALPTVTSPVLQLGTSGARSCLVDLTPGGVLGAKFFDGANQGAVVGPTVTAGSWHAVELRCNTSSTGAWTLDWRVDGVPQPTATYTPGVADPVARIDLGLTTATTASLRIDDVAFSATATDFPLGDGQVLALRPDGAAGADVNDPDFANDDLSIGTGGSWNRLAESPFGPTSTWVQQATIGATDTLSFTFADAPLQRVANGLYGLVAFHSSAVGTNDGTTRVVRADATTLPIYAGDMGAGGTTLAWQGAALAAPTGGWTPTEVNALTARIGFSADVTPLPRWDGLLLEVDYPRP